LIWICVRSGFEGATAGLLLTQVGLIVAVQAAGYATASVLEFQLLMLALTVTGAFLGMAVSQWRRTSSTLMAREVELNRTLRVAAAAEMASALAHELNQPLTAASNYVQACDIMLREPGARGESLASTVRKASAELQRAGEVVRWLRDFYRGGEARRERVHVKDLVATAVRPLENRLERQHIRLVKRLPEALPPLVVDRAQIETVIHNVVANAIDAIVDARSEVREIAIAADVENGALALSIHDTGPGVSPAIVPELFKTFTTSKRAGMGLGLAMSRSIVESHGGRVWLDATSGGARFVLSLPYAGAQP
jgi:C4-dicarboxylate-specific signal transduction histidine kinase